MILKGSENLDTALTPDGDFLLGSNGLPVKIYDVKEILQKILIKLTTRKRSFIYDKDFGSDLYKLRDASLDNDSLKKEAEIIIKEILYDVPQAKFTDLSLEILENEEKKIQFNIFLEINNKNETLVVKV